MSKSRQLLRVADIAPQLGVTSGRVYQLISAGEIPAIRVGNAVRVPAAAWEAWLRSRNEAALASVREGVTASDRGLS